VIRVAGFTTDLDTRLVDEFADTHMLLAALCFYSALLGALIVAPTGFITDFASVPRIVLAYLLFGGKGKRAAVIHDWLYSGALVWVRGELRALTREECDAVFREALQATGYNKFTVWAMFTGVRIGGAARFNAPNVPQEPHVQAAIDYARPEAP
jgi:hypothetical protein